MTTSVIAVLYCLVPAATFVLLFGMVDWHKNRAGRAVMAFAFVATVLL